jgi:hypothetical protein
MELGPENKKATPRAALGSTAPMGNAALPLARRANHAGKSSRETRPVIHTMMRKLDLGPVHQRLGEHWSRYEDAIYRITGKVIGDAVGPKDAWSRSGDVFTIRFGEGPNGRIEAVYARIERRLTELLFGTGLESQSPEGSRNRGAGAHRGRGKKQGFFQLFSRLVVQFRALRGARRAKTSNSSATVPAATTGPIKAVMPQAAKATTAEPAPMETALSRVGHSEHPAGTLAKPSAVRARSSAECRVLTTENPTFPAPGNVPAHAAAHASSYWPEPSAHSPALRLNPLHSGGTLPIRMARRNAQEIRLIESAIVDATIRRGKVHVRDTDAVEAIVKQVRFGYRPMWNTRNNVLSIYSCVATIEGNGGFREGDAVLPHPASDEAKALLDQLVIPNATFDVEALIREERKVLIVLPIHFASFVNEWSAKQLINLCHHIPEAGRRRIIFEIVDAAGSRADPRLRDAVHALKPYCLRLGARLPLLRQDMRFWRQIGFETVGVDLAAASAPESELISELDRFYIAARQEGLMTVAHGLNTRSLVFAAATMGVNVVNGAPISGAATTGDLDGMPFTLADLYSDILRREVAEEIWQV